MRAKPLLGESELPFVQPSTLPVSENEAGGLALRLACVIKAKLPSSSTAFSPSEN